MVEESGTRIAKVAPEPRIRFPVGDRVRQAREDPEGDPTATEPHRDHEPKREMERMCRPRDVLEAAAYFSPRGPGNG